METAGSGRGAATQEAFGRFKYGAELRRIGSLVATTPATGPAFRLVHEPPVDRDFVPQAMLREIENQSCSSWGLSMFTSLEAARSKINGLAAKYTQIKKQLGDHIASGTLLPPHGEMTPPNRKKHFDLFEYVDVEVRTAFIVVCKS